MFITVAFAQESIVRGKITYIAGESVYTSLGRESGVKDSSMLYVFSNLDTITTLIVFATSSKSSVCKIIKTKRQLHIGDIVNTVIRIMDKSAQEQKRPSPIADTTQTIPQPALFVAQNIARQQPSQPFASFQGSFSLQYFTIREASYSLNISQPVAALNLRGRINETPIKFQLYGNFRSLKYGSTRPFNQTRIYRLSIDYDDEINQISVGRVILSNAPSIGFIDGIAIARKFRGFTFGSAAGFEPSTSHQNLSTDTKKFSVFGNYQSPGSATYSVNLAYGRIFYRSQLDREVVSSYVTIIPSNTLFFTGQGEVDIRTKKDQTFILKPKLTNVSANLNYHPFNFLSAGIGMAAWRSTYRFSLVKAIPDSLLDRELRLNPTVSLNVFLPGSISIYDTYSPRPTNNGFGKEYSNNTTIGISNLFRQGIIVRGTMTLNSTTFSSTRGYGINVQKPIANIADVSLRYQFYRSVILQNNNINTRRTIGLDLMISALKDITVWGSFEQLIRPDANAFTVSAEISWRF
jgi:hypothetical protein